jgi:hypothetical protein
MDGKRRRFRTPNQPPAQGTGSSCDQPTYEEEACNEGEDSECSDTCEINGKIYDVGEIIEEESQACGRKCYCNVDGLMTCEDVEVVCEPCAEGMERDTNPDRPWQDCCKCVQKPCESCHKEVNSLKIKFNIEEEEVCESPNTEDIEVCRGSCPSSQYMVLLNGKMMAETDCKCCQATPGGYRDVVVNCENESGQQTSKVVKVAINITCACEECVPNVDGGK